MARAHTASDLRDFWQECKDIKSSIDIEEDEDATKTPDEGENEAAWLQQAGYGFVVNKFQAGKELTEDEIHALTETLPSNHADVVKRRVDTLNATLRKKQKYTTKIDVRNIFPQQGNSTSNDEDLKQLPRSPTSPRGEVVHPEWAANRNRAGKGRHQQSLLKNKGGYSMSGVSEEVQDNDDFDVEMLSVQHRGTFPTRSGQLSPISDADITFEFSIEETEDPSSPHGLTNSYHDTEEGLPNFNMVAERLGQTMIDDISQEDMTYVKKKALFELTSMFDEQSIMYSRRRSKQRYKENSIFGVPLHVLFEHDEKLKPNIKIPLVFQQILLYLSKHALETEGILRVPGSTSRVKNLRQELEDKFYQGTFIWGSDLTPNDVAALMKQFIRDLPMPLLTEEYIEAFAQAESLPDKKQQLHALNLLILLLPTVNRDTLSALLELLEQIIQHSDVNKMTLNNVAMIMAPNLFMTPKVAPGKGGKSAWDYEMKMAAGTSYIMRMIIRYRHILWTVPSYIMAMVRRQYELEQIRKNKDKLKMKFLAKKDKTEVYKKPAVKHEADFHEGVIRVQAPNLTKSSTAIKLDESMTAGDIVSKFKVIQGTDANDNSGDSANMNNVGHGFNSTKNFHSAGDDTFLFEKGGNIGERCLPNNTNMMALYRVNPNAEWIIKQRDKTSVT